MSQPISIPAADKSQPYFRLPLILLGIVVLLCLATGYQPPAGRLNWLLEVGPGLLGITALLVTARRLPMSHWVYTGCFLHFCVLVYGGYYTYAATPLGDWARETFALSRNPYDRVGHVALGVFPAFVIREVLLRRTPLPRGGWLYFIVVCIVLAVAAFWELLEWWTVLGVAPEVGQAYLGSQGDVWDAQWDMFLALLGALIVLPLLGKAHDRSMARIPAAVPQPKP
jgi:putative membrane protein